MFKTKQTVCTVVVFLLMTALLTFPGMAMDSAGFSVKPVLPANQNPGTSGYFDLTVQPGQAQELEIIITNKDEREMTALVEAITASTNQNGIINYTSPGPMDETLQHSFADIATVKQERVVVPPQSSVSATILVEIPQEPFEGLMLGSIQVLKELTQEELDSGDMLINQYSFVLGVRLTQTGEEVAPAFQLGEVTPQLTNRRASIVNYIRNPVPVLIKGMDASVQIVSKRTDQVVFERTKGDVDMAPNSVYPFTLVDEAGYGLQAGTYISRVHLEYQGESWDFEQEFEIQAEEAASINQNALNQTQQTAVRSASVPAWVIAAACVGAVLMLLIVVLLLILLIKRNSNKAANNL